MTEKLRALRDGFGEGIIIAAEKDRNVIALSADLTESNRLVRFRERYPSRFVEVGVAEQNLIGLAAGMARVGKIPFTASFAVFSPGRSWDQIRVSLCYSEANVKIYGGHAGITVGEDGASHQAMEDIAIMRALPNMRVIVPADANEMKRATIAAAMTKGPVYLRGGRLKYPATTSERSSFTIGKANILCKGHDVTLVACGIMVREALLAALELRKRGISAEVINMHTIKPLDRATLISSAQKTMKVVTAEEHQVDGGLGSAVCETLAEHFPCPVLRVGMMDRFGESGPAEQLLKKYRLNASGIITAVNKVMKR